jgi:hypothetical protein
MLVLWWLKCNQIGSSPRYNIISIRIVKFIIHGLIGPFLYQIIFAWFRGLIVGKQIFSQLVFTSVEAINFRTNGVDMPV